MPPGKRSNVSSVKQSIISLREGSKISRKQSTSSGFSISAKHSATSGTRSDESSSWFRSASMDTITEAAYGVIYKAEAATTVEYDAPSVTALVEARVREIESSLEVRLQALKAEIQEDTMQRLS